jgi:Icc-related predicted phosphoesterase
MNEEKLMRIAAVGDLHYTKLSAGRLKDYFLKVSDSADVLVICGDFTDYGLPEEAAVLAEDLKTYVRIPIVGVVGNHDFESGKIVEVKSILEATGINLLDGDVVEIMGAGFAGICGFCGGFDRHMLNAWGEPLIKAFVQETLDHSMRLEKALSRLTTEKRIVLLHYAPIRETVIGESPEIFPFLGSSRLEAPLNQYKVSVVFHGHAHNGTSSGTTSGEVPVFNVALPVLSRESSSELPIFIYRI